MNRAPFPQGQRQREIVGQNAVGVGFGGRGNRPHMNDRPQRFAVRGQKLEDLFGMDHIGQFALGQIAPFFTCAQAVADHQFGFAPFGQGRHNIGSDEPRAAGDDNHGISSFETFRPYRRLSGAGQARGLHFPHNPPYCTLSIWYFLQGTSPPCKRKNPSLMIWPAWPAAR